MKPELERVAIAYIAGGPLRRVWIAATQTEVVQVGLAGSKKRFIQELKNQNYTPGGPDKWLAKAARQLTEYLAGKRRVFSLAVSLPAGPPFSRRVFQLLRKVPYGTTLTYQQLARRAASPKASRAVGNIMAANPLPLIIPCHRVVATAGLGGFGGGLKMKQALLDMEGARLRFRAPRPSRNRTAPRS
ncbi:MAG: methylated-DNA--[protein]-cysteine S-methyltransferase [Deltaproteobacteria bacterium]|nr:methylated-DNA--[protein]-cysteine S-methyltransferase [Deltaproteobacteria bacterium]MBW1872951.1 methylated-DNA--[protein]-cysteine S-methyltransferase [Deltaproteobacteria bacterium]